MNEQEILIYLMIVDDDDDEKKNETTCESIHHNRSHDWMMNFLWTISQIIITIITNTSSSNSIDDYWSIDWNTSYLVSISSS